jgi:hypothetical protein
MAQIPTAMLQTTFPQPQSDEVPKRLGGATGKGWMPGCSGNPSGRRNERRFKGKTLPELAREMTAEALETVRQVMHMPDIPPAMRLQAADIVLRRGWGDAPRTPDLGDGELRIVVQSIAVEAKAVAGVIASPIAEHVPCARPVTGSIDVIDAEGSMQ